MIWNWLGKVPPEAVRPGLATGRPKDPWRNMVYGHFRYAEMARDTRHKIVLHNNGQGPNELHDLATGPREHTNQYGNGQFLLVRQRLTREVESWRKYA